MLATSQKVSIARSLSAVVVGLRRCCGFSAQTTVERKGLTWALNLKEGIDLSIYLLGGFELRVLRRYREFVRQGDVVIDVGANIGAHTLPLGQLVGETGRVIAIELIQYAFGKLQANIAMNPHVVARVTVHQAMLSGHGNDRLPDAIYSSWPLEASDDLHDKHRGRLMSTESAKVTTLDEVVRSHGSLRVRLLDVDGNEYGVLRGGQETFSTHKPILVMELAPYVHEGHSERFDETLRVLWSLGYQPSDVATGRPMPRDPAVVRRLIPLHAASVPSGCLPNQCICKAL